jgi:uncharacterized protein
MGIPKPVLNRLLAVFNSEQAVEKVYLFGSRARGDYRDNSDIDIALVGNQIRKSVMLVTVTTDLAITI